MYAVVQVWGNEPLGSFSFRGFHVSVLVCFRPVCPSGDGGVLELCSSSSPLDPLPYSTWPFIYSASLEGEPEGGRGFHANLSRAVPFSNRCLAPALFPKGLRRHSALWKDQFRETTGAVRAVLPAPHTNWYIKGNGRLHKAAPPFMCELER